MRRLAVILFIWFVLFSRSAGQDVTVRAAFDSTRILIGDQVNFRITIEQPSDLKLALPFYRDSLVRNVEILSGPFVDSSFTAGSLKITESYLVTVFDSGTYIIPPVYAELKNESGIKRFYSDNARLQVMRPDIAPADTAAKIFDIVAPYRAPITFGEIIPWLLLAGVMALLAWLVIGYIRKNRKVQVIPEPKINPEPAHVIAFRELEKLRNEELWQTGETKKYYSRLTEILRQYLENRYGVFSLEMTTSETLGSLLETGFRKDALYEQLKTVLTGADLVKFAKYKPDQSENEAHFRNSWEFVDSTKLVVIPAPDEDKKEAGV